MAIKVLVLTPQTPYPPDQGAPIRNFNFIRYLGSSPAYELSLLSFGRPEERDPPPETPSILEKLCNRVEIVTPPNSRSKISRLKAQAFGSLPDLALRLNSNDFKIRLKELLDQENFAAILCEGLELAPFLMEAFKSWNKPRPLLILDEHNTEYLLQKRVFQSEVSLGVRRLPAAIYSWSQYIRLKKFETKALKFFDRVIAVSENEKAALNLLLPEKAIAVIPNGIDLEEFKPPSEPGEELPYQLIFSGTMDFRPNVDAVLWFARKVWPQVRKAKPQATFIITGKRPSPAVEGLGKLPGIKVTGPVKDIRPYILQSAVFVLPMRMGGGVRLKLLEALALGKALVTTPFGADGVPLTPGKEAIFANDPAAFAKEVIFLLDQPEVRKKLGEAGRDFVEKNYGWKMISPLLEAVLEVEESFLKLGGSEENHVR